MTVAELIIELRKLDQSLDVRLAALDSSEAHVSIESLYEGFTWVYDESSGNHHQSQVVVIG